VRRAPIKLNEEVSEPINVRRLEDADREHIGVEHLLPGQAAHHDDPFDNVSFAIKRESAAQIHCQRRDAQIDRLARGVD